MRPCQDALSPQLEIQFHVRKLVQDEVMLAGLMPHGWEIWLSLGTLGATTWQIPLAKPSWLITAVNMRMSISPPSFTL